MSNPCITSDSSSFIIYDSLDAVWLWNPSVTRDSISMMIYESLEAVWVFESMRSLSQQFVDDL